MKGTAVSHTEIQASTINAQLDIEQAELTDGIPCMWTDQGSKVRVAYDPQQIDENTAKAVVILNVGDTRRQQLGTDGAREHTEGTEDQPAARTLAECVVATQGAEGLDRLIAALPDVVDESMRNAIPHRYSPELAAAITQTMTGILTGALCPVWPSLCTDTSVGHLVHLNREHKVTDKRGESLLDVAFLQFTDDESDGPAVICIGAEDFDPSEVRAKTAELRRLLDQADEMADKVLALRA